MLSLQISGEKRSKTPTERSGALPLWEEFVIAAIRPYIGFYFPDARRLSPASEIAERAAVHSDISLFLQGNRTQSEEIIEKQFMFA